MSNYLNVLSNLVYVEFCICQILYMSNFTMSYSEYSHYGPASQITSISTKSDSKTLLLQFGIIVRVLGAHFLALKNDPCTANNPAVNIEHTPRKFLHLTITITKDIHTKT